ncbi:hypothetical protein [Streptomyces endophyticus]|uniref:Uncharacterized protein n=1 Tax=Streptomyces endophyticus TaxID=714166 RepID=A0ABU6FF70_9ACTN|nr:hypothetical protein [Streptomyces endophyticus]MEB8342695.1 hypothetical protein [Streptomyces endophyticus]
MQGQFNSYVFKRHQTSRDDLRTFIGEMLSDDDDVTDQRWSQAAVAALRDVTAPEFVLVCSTHWAFASFEVRSSAIPEAGTAFYNEWVGSMSFDEEAQWALKLSEEPVVLRP